MTTVLYVLYRNGVERQLREALDESDNALTLSTLARHYAEVRQRERMPSIGQAAIGYAKRGLYVFPLTRLSKVPLAGSRGCLDATLDQQRIARWWRETPEANVGIATGHGVDVVDIDGEHGLRAWRQDWNTPDVLGQTRTPRLGGLHYYVRATGNGNRASIMPGVDYRGKGGYVVAPPSLTKDGAYVWQRELTL